MDNACPICGGYPLLLGRLGSLEWYRCQGCGLEWSKTVKKDEKVDRIVDQ